LCAIPDCGSDALPTARESGMTKIRTLLGAAALALALAGCGRGDQAAGGLSPDEERQLDNAAAMLDENNLVVPDDSMVANQAEIDAEENAAGAGADAADNAE
jgi:hypothetical protein